MAITGGKIISGAVTATSLSAGIALASTTFSNQKVNLNKPITLKERLVKRGFVPVKGWGFKASSISTDLLREYGLFETNKLTGVAQFNFQEWCQKQEETTEDDADLTKKVEKLCFETVASKIQSTGKVAILTDDDNSEWQTNLSNFQEFKRTAETNDSDFTTSWSVATDLNGLKKQCKINGEKSMNDENKKIFEEFEKWCTRKIIWSGGSH